MDFCSMSLEEAEKKLIDYVNKPKPYWRALVNHLVKLVASDDWDKYSRGRKLLYTLIFYLKERG